MRKPDLRSSSSSMGEEEERRELSEGFREGELLSPCSTDRELGRSSSDWGKRRTEEEVEKKKCYRAERVFTECDLIFLTACFCYFTGIKAIQPQRKLYYLYFSMRLYCIVCRLVLGMLARVQCPFVETMDSWHSESQSCQMNSRPWCHSLSTTPEKCVCLYMNLSDLFFVQTFGVWVLFIISISPSCSSPALRWRWPVQQHWVFLNCWDEQTDEMPTENGKKKKEIKLAAKG